MSTPDLLAPWVKELSLQQQSVLLMCLRGPDGFPKNHGAKHVIRAIRALTIRMARTGRVMEMGECRDTFMDLRMFTDNDVGDGAWLDLIRSFEEVIDSLPLHFFQHVSCAAAILRKHPEPTVASRFNEFYEMCADYMHMQPETIEAMDKRLNDWGRAGWSS